MGRAPRADIAGGVHHVMNRGGAHRTIFHTAADGCRFLELLGEAACSHGVRVLAYCLMSNHFHLLLSCPDGGLSELMHRLGSRYARHHNDRLGADGPIFRGRFHSLLVDTEEYLACAGRYIHRNPLDVRPTPPLDEYRWSSYRYYVTDAEPPSWLSTAELLGPNGRPGSYRAFVEGDSTHERFQWAVDTALLEAADDELQPGKIRRTVLLAMLDRAEGRAAERLQQLVDFPSDSARYAAVYRMRRLVAERPDLLAIAERARRLAA